MLGTAGLGGIWGEVTESDAVAVVLQALDAGISHIDTAPAYGNAEEIVGIALRGASRKPAISTKAGKLSSRSPDATNHDYSAVALRSSVENSLKTLGVDRVETVFLHDPESLPDTDVDGALTCLRHMRDEGMTARIGIGGNYPPSFEKYISTENFSTFMGFNRLNAIQQVALAHEYPLMQRLGISIWQASPLYMGLLGGRYAQFQENAPPWFPVDALEPARRLKALSDEVGMALPTLAMRYLLSVRGPDKIVIGASSRAELSDCLQSWAEGPLEEALFVKVSNIAAAKSAA